MYVLLSLCLSVSLHISKTSRPNVIKCLTCYLWPWLGPSLMAMQCVTYFRRFMDDVMSCNVLFIVYNFLYVFTIRAFRRHRMYALRRCGPLLRMSHVAWYVCLCVLGTRVSCAKTAEQIEMPFGRLIQVSPRNHVLDGALDRTNLFAAARGDSTAMRPLAKLL